VVYIPIQIYSVLQTKPNKSRKLKIDILIECCGYIEIFVNFSVFSKNRFAKANIRVSDNYFVLTVEVSSDLFFKYSRLKILALLGKVFRP